MKIRDDTLLNFKGPFSINKNNFCYRVPVGPDSSVCTETRYGLDGPGIESRWGRDFPHPSRRALWPTQPPVLWVPDLSRGDKAAGAWRWPPTQSSSEVEGRVELNLYSPSVPSWPVMRWTLPLPLPLSCTGCTWKFCRQTVFAAPC